MESYPDNCSSWMFNYTWGCYNMEILPCNEKDIPASPSLRYSDVNAVWVLTAAIIVFFMKAGFMLIEVAFANNPSDRRHVIILKHQDAFASAFGFFLFGFDLVSGYITPYDQPEWYWPYYVSEPGMWFFKFTFASNAATIVGGCLVANTHKLRIPAAFISAFVISAFIHPAVARIIWADDKDSLSPYRYCDYREYKNKTFSWKDHCDEDGFNMNKVYILDFAGGGAVHGIGGIVGLVLCLFAKLQEWKDKKQPLQDDVQRRSETRELVEPRNFWQWMYPDNGGNEAPQEAALGVLILWFSWFAFNCGSTENMEGKNLTEAAKSNIMPYHRISGIVAVNMIMAGASGGVVAIAIAVWAQLRYRTESVNANEIANGVLSALVSITAGCAFVDYWGAVVIGAIGVIIYHLGSLMEYKLGIKDTARVFPVHGLCGLWSMIAIGVFTFGAGECHLHDTFEHTCHCSLRLPRLKFEERLLCQIFGAVIVLCISVIGSVAMFLPLYLIPVKPIVYACERLFFLNFNNEYRPLHKIYRGGMLFTTPEENTLAIKKDYENHALLQQESADSDEPTLNLRDRKKKSVEDYGSIRGHCSMRGRVPATPEASMTVSASSEV